MSGPTTDEVATPRPRRWSVGSWIGSVGLVASSALGAVFVGARPLDYILGGDQQHSVLLDVLIPIALASLVLNVLLIARGGVDRVLGMIGMGTLLAPFAAEAFWIGVPYL
jgi:hypothetical protein